MTIRRTVLVAGALFVMAMLGVAAGLLAIRGGALLDSEPVMESK